MIVEREYSTPAIEHAFLEPEAGVAVPDAAGVTVYVGSQIPFEDRRVVAETLGIAEEHVRVIQTAVGGAFGGKEDVSVQAHAALAGAGHRAPGEAGLFAARVLRGPPQAPRHNDPPEGWRRPRGQADARGGHDLGRHRRLCQPGRPRADHGPPPTWPALTSCPHVHVDCWAAYTNNPPAGAMRGFGVPQAAFAMESAMDELADRLGLHPLELRRRNAVTVGSVTATGQLLRDSVGLMETIDRVQARRSTGWGPRCWNRQVPGR